MNPQDLYIIVNEGTRTEFKVDEIKKIAAQIKAVE